MNASRIIQELYKRLIWSIPETQPVVYLTFDDGPVPGVTPWVLETLERYNAKATFFAVGDNIRKYPSIKNSICAHGHLMGNHTQHHINGWNHAAAAYVNDIATAGNHLESRLFRPPYGKITPMQIKALRSSYHIIMWTILTKDFDRKKNPDYLLKRALYHTRPGVILLFHDSVKAWKNMSAILPRYLQLLTETGYKFKPLDENALEKFYSHHRVYTKIP